MIKTGIQKQKDKIHLKLEVKKVLRDERSLNREKFCEANITFDCVLTAKSKFWI